MTRRQYHSVSIRRRHMLMAAGAGALAPAFPFAAALAAAPPPPGGARLVLSGSLRGADAAPLAGRIVEIHGAHRRACFATTDGDGRFVLEMPAPPGLGRLALHIDGARPQSVTFAADAAGGIDSPWRAAVGITLA